MKYKNILVEAIEETEKKLGVIIESYPNKGLLGENYITLEEENQIDSENETILLIIQEKFISVSINLKKEEVTGYGIEGKEPTEEIQQEMKRLGYELIEKIKVYKAF